MCKSSQKKKPLRNEQRGLAEGIVAAGVTGHEVCSGMAFRNCPDRDLCILPDQCLDADCPGRWGQWGANWVAWLPMMPVEFSRERSAAPPHGSGMGAYILKGVSAQLPRFQTMAPLGVSCVQRLCLIYLHWCLALGLTQSDQPTNGWLCCHSLQGHTLIFKMVILHHRHITTLHVQYIYFSNI